MIASNFHKNTISKGCSHFGTKESNAQRDELAVIYSW